MKITADESEDLWLSANRLFYQGKTRAPWRTGTRRDETLVEEEIIDAILEGAFMSADTWKDVSPFVVGVARGGGCSFP